MKKYLLLRDNKESGPFSLEEISGKDLGPLDLIWVEHTSTSWAYATELEELKGFVRLRKAGSHSQSIKQKTVCISLTDNNTWKNHQAAAQKYMRQPSCTNKPVAEPVYLQPIPVFPERSVEENPRKMVWSRKNVPNSNFLNVAAVFIGLVAGAVLIKKLVDGSEAGPSGNAPIAARVTENIPPLDRNYHTALITETVPPTDLRAVKKIPLPSVKPKDIKRQISVKASDYEVGISGGISNLKLTLNNMSPHQVDRMVLKLDYLEPNGEIVESKEETINSLKPNSSRVISVPSNKHGVKIRYSISGIYSKEYKLALKQV